MPSIVVLGLAWVTGLFSVRTRNLRFVLLASISSVSWLITYESPQDLAGLRVAIAICLGTAVLFPEYFGIGSVSRAERKADDIIGNLNPRSIASQRARLEYVERVRRVVPKDPGRIVAVRLLLWSSARRFDNEVVASTVPADYFERAGRHFLLQAQWHRVLGAERPVSVWDEDVALRCFHDEAMSLVPRSVFARHPPIVLGQWAAASNVLLSDLASAPMRDAAAQSARLRLIDAIEAYLSVARGDRSPQAKERQTDTAAEMMKAWQFLDTQVEVLRLRP
jgi:hypothetical protein